jgi:hypothetical protein
VAAGLVAAAALPVAVAVSQGLKTFRLLDSWAAIPVAIVLGAVAIVLARRARAGSPWAVAPAAGGGAARAGRWLGILGVYLGLTGILTLVCYELLVRFSK